MIRHGFRLTLAALFLGASLPAGSVELEDGVPMQVNIPPQSINTAFTIEVPANAVEVTVTLEDGGTDDQDIELFVRVGQPFQNFVQIYDEASYYSNGNGGFEYFTATQFSSPPVGKGTWYVALINRDASSASTATLSVDITRGQPRPLPALEMDVVFSDPPGYGFNDTTPFAGEGGNNAATLGEARQAAFMRAAGILEQSFRSPVPLTVEAHFEDPVDECPEALACAGSNFGANSPPGSAYPDTRYQGATAVRVSGTDNCRLFKEFPAGFDGSDGTEPFTCDNPMPDIGVNINIDHDWWYGFQVAPNTRVDFIAVILHELFHGLGFSTGVKLDTGARPTDSQTGEIVSDLYARNLVYRSGGELKPFESLTDNQRVMAMQSGDDLLWKGPVGWRFWAANGDSLDDSSPLPPMYAPAQSDGSQASHVNFPDIMFPNNGPVRDGLVDARSPGESLGAGWHFLRDMEWDERRKTPIRLGMWYDPARDGHGIDFQRAGDTYFLVFYTYDDQGDPEWYLAIGSVDNGLFSGELFRFTYDPSDSPPQTGVSVGNVTVEFNVTGNDPACDDGVNRNSALGLARFDWSIDGEHGAWCVIPLIGGGPPPDPDFTGHWFAGDADQGWGMTIYQQQPVLFAVLYFYDGQGNPRWALGIDDSFVNGDTLTMLHFNGYCRSCGFFQEDLESGPMTLQFGTPSQAPAGNTVDIDVDYPGPEGGGWERDDTSIQLLSDPAG